LLKQTGRGKSGLGRQLGDTLAEHLAAVLPERIADPRNRQGVFRQGGMLQHGHRNDVKRPMGQGVV
jgi:hypothetical protein